MAARRKSGKCRFALAKSGKPDQKTLASGRPWAAVTWQVSGVFRQNSEKFHYRFTRKVHIQGLSGPPGARIAPFPSESSPHRPTPASDLPRLPQRNMSGFFFVTGCRTRGRVIFAGSREMVGAHPRLKASVTCHSCKPVSKGVACPLPAETTDACRRHKHRVAE